MISESFFAMMWTPRKILCIIAFVAVTGIVVVYCEDFEDLFGDADYDHDDWLDPGDMFNYNPNAKKKVQSKVSVYQCYSCFCGHLGFLVCENEMSMKWN